MEHTKANKSKILALILGLTMCLVLVACGDKGSAATELGSDSGVSVAGVFDKDSTLSVTLHDRQRTRQDGYFDNRQTLRQRKSCRIRHHYYKWRRKSATER